MATSFNPRTGFRFFKPQLFSVPLSSFPLSHALPQSYCTFKFPATRCRYSSLEVKDFFTSREEFWSNFWTKWKRKNNTVAGISKPTSGSIYIQKYGDDGNPSQSPEPLVPERVGIVFQFPERYFVADTVLDEVTFGWPRQKGNDQSREQLALGLQRAINWVGLSGISLDKNPHSLSGGYKRRLALAIQLVQIPDLLILDEPLAGLDWKARVDVVKLLKHLKKELTVLVVSHDLREFASLVDQSWRMEMGGNLRQELLPL
ncbi:unnamed protein product [Vicia faba]|uniref:ABC transporter domain-containing protein n=1 Tax=Vicia faba TaxID=3906 RepID=A0AAV1ANS4_VICFA|nr:unnamed protein product [Vicia faba]